MVELALEPLAAENNLRILHATSGEEALSLLETHPSTMVLLTDLAMPTMDGLELIAHCRQRYPLLQVVVLSGATDGASVIKAVRAGATDYILKPPTLVELESALASAITRYTELERAVKIREQLHQYERELAIASEIQRHMLPPSLDEDPAARYRVSAVLMPARHVAGDFYDHWQTTDRQLVLSIGDVSGKGISAALWMAVTKTLLRSHMEQLLSPAAALEATNRALSSNNPQAYFVTATVAVFEPSTGMVTLSSAAHPAPYRVTADGTVERLPTQPGMPLGALETSSYYVTTAQLRHGDRLILFTDGVLDTLSTDLAQQQQRWEQLLDRAIAHGGDLMAAIISELSAQWLSPALPDDITIVSLEYGTQGIARSTRSK